MRPWPAETPLKNTCSQVEERKRGKFDERPPAVTIPCFESVLPLRLFHTLPS